MKDIDYEEFLEKYHSSSNAINNQILEEGLRSVVPSTSLIGSAREEVSVDAFKGTASLHNYSHESVIVRGDTMSKVVMYRDITRYPEVSNVVEQIVNDCIIYDDVDEAVYLNIDNTKFSSSVKNKIAEEFEEIKRILNVGRDLKRYFRDWYVDSKLFFENVYDDADDTTIVEMRKLDPVAVVPKMIDLYGTDDNGNKYYTESKLVFEYNNNMSYMTDQQQMNISGQGMFGGQTQRTLESKQITYAHSGIFDCKGLIKGHLHQAVKPAHTLKMIEDALIIYRLTRSPDRKIFYIDTGTQPPAKAEEMMRKVMNANTKKMGFDSVTGKLTTKTGSPLMVDDYYLQRSNGLNVTDVDTLSGATGMNELDDLRWHNKKLYEALKVPLSRMPNENVVMFGDDGGTTRDEINFQKLIFSFRKSFSEIFLIPLKINLIGKKIITEKDWEQNKEKIFIKYVENEYFKEKAKLELMRERADIAETYLPWVGKVVSYEFVSKYIFKMSEEEIERERALIKKERENEILYPPEETEEFDFESNRTTIDYRSNAKNKPPETENNVTINKEE